MEDGNVIVVPVILNEQKDLFDTSFELASKLNSTNKKNNCNIGPNCPNGKWKDKLISNGIKKNNKKYLSKLGYFNSFCLNFQSILLDENCLQDKSDQLFFIKFFSELFKFRPAWIREEITEAFLFLDKFILGGIDVEEYIKDTTITEEDKLLNFKKTLIAFTFEIQNIINNSIPITEETILFKWSSEKDVNTIYTDSNLYQLPQVGNNNSYYQKNPWNIFFSDPTELYLSECNQKGFLMIMKVPQESKILILPETQCKREKIMIPYGSVISFKSVKMETISFLPYSCKSKQPDVSVPIASNTMESANTVTDGTNVDETVGKCPISIGDSKTMTVRIYKSRLIKAKQFENIPMFDGINKGDWYSMVDRYSAPVARKGFLKSQIIEQLIQHFEKLSKISFLKETILYTFMTKTYFEYSKFQFGKNHLSSDETRQFSLFDNNLFADYLMDYFDAICLKYFKVEKQGKHKLIFN